MEPTKEDNRHRLSFAILAICWQVLMIILFAFLTDYGSGAKLNTGTQTDMDHYYPLFQDVNVMIFVGFGFLMTFLSKYGFSAVGYNFLISAFTVQWAIITNGVMHGAFHQNSTGGADPFHANCPALGAAASSSGNDFNKTRFCIELNIENLITGDFAAGAVMITFGAVLGKTNPMQMMVVAIFEIIVYALNENIGAGRFSAVDMGGSIFVHTFGAYFGLALSLTISSAKDGTGKVVDRPKNGSSKTSDLFAMIGTLFLWMFWPSFNGALATNEQQHRVVINTVLALCACCISAFAMDAFLRPDHKFDMVSIQNATLAGGVAVGSSSDLVIQPYGALIVGCIAGIVSVVGYVHLDPCFRKLGLDDTCGVNNLHGMPGIVGAIGGAISAASAGSTAYGESIGTVFPARAGPDGRTAGEQAGYQLAALAVTLLTSLLGGMLTGLIIKLPSFQYRGPIHEGTEDNAQPVKFLKLGAALDERVWYDDKYYWEVPSESETEHQTIVPVNGGDDKDDPSEAKEDFAEVDPSTPQ